MFHSTDPRKAREPYGGRFMSFTALGSKWQRVSMMRAIKCVEKASLMSLVMTAHEEEEHGQQHQEEVHHLRLEVLLAEDHCSEKETDNDATTPHH